MSFTFVQTLRRKLRGALAPFAGALERFIDEAAFRVVLAFDVLVGRMPRRTERRWWNRAIESPALVEVYDWTDERLIFSVLVWPSVESQTHEASFKHRARVEEVVRAICQGAADRAWSVRYEVDYGLRWEAEKQVWTARDGHAYEPPAKLPRTKEMGRA